MLTHFVNFGTFVTQIILSMSAETVIVVGVIASRSRLTRT